MDPVTALLALAVVLLAAVAIGLLLRRRDGRVRAARGDVVTPASLGEPDAALGARATLVQFSTEYCTRCPAARRVLGAVAGETPGVVHLDVDLTHRPEVARRFGILQTPTTLIVDAAGVLRARIGGAPRRDDVARELDRLLEDARV